MFDVILSSSQSLGCGINSKMKRQLSLKSASPRKRTIRSDSLSKVISAGVRIGWLTGPNEVIEKVEVDTTTTPEDMTNIVV